MTYQEIKNKINELAARTGRAAIKVADVFGLMGEMNDKMRDIDVSATATVRQSYDTYAAAIADKNPIDPETNKPIKIGQLISITDDTDTTKNAVYRIASFLEDGTPVLEFQGKLGDMSLYAKKSEVDNVLALKAEHGYESNPKTLKEVDDNLAQLAGEVNLKEVKSNKQNSLAEDGTGEKYPTVDAVREAVNSIPLQHIKGIEQNKNLFDLTNKVNNHYINDANGQSTPLDRYGHTGYIEIKSNTEHTVSADISNGVRIAFYEGDKSFIRPKIELTRTQLENGYTFTTPINAEFVIFDWYITEPVLQLEIGSVKTSYEENSLIADKLTAKNAEKLKTPRKINGVSFDGTKDICIDIGEFSDEVVPYNQKNVKRGKNIFHRINELKDTYISEQTGTPEPLANYYTTDFFEVEPSTNYTISTKYGVPVIYFFDENKSYIPPRKTLGGDVKKGIVFTTPDNAKYIRVIGYEPSIPHSEIQIEEGTIKTHYEPYTYTYEGFNVADWSNSNSGKLSRKALMVGLNENNTSVLKNRVAEDLYRCGFLLECCSMYAFLNSFNTVTDSVDLIILADVNLPFNSELSLVSLEGNINRAKLKGIKFIIMYDAFYTTKLTIGKNVWNGYGFSDDKIDISPMFGGIDVQSLTISEESEPLFVGSGRNIVQENMIAKGYMSTFSGGDDSIEYPVKIETSSGDLNMVAVKKNDFAVVGYGGYIGGKERESASYQYVDFANLIFELFDIPYNHRLAMDSAYGRKVASMGVDCDITDDKIALKRLAKAVNGNAKLEFGIVGDNITKELASIYRSLKTVRPDIAYCTHTMDHYLATKVIKIVDEEHTIDEFGVVVLENTAKVKITSVQSSDGSITYSRKGDSFRFGQPNINEYSALGTPYSPTQLLVGKLKFNLDAVGLEVKITYEYFDDFRNVITSVHHLSEIGLLTNKATYMTQGDNSLSSATYEQAEMEGITICDYLTFPANSRTYCTTLGSDKKMPILNGNLMKSPKGYSIDDVNTFIGHTFEDVQDIMVPYLLSEHKKRELPFVWYIHDMALSSGDRNIHNSAGYNSSWKKATEAQSIAGAERFYAYVTNMISLSKVTWMYRSEYTKMYQDMNKHIRYDFKEDDNKIYLYATNSGGETLKGVTFRVESPTAPKSVIRLNNERLQFNHEDGIITFYLDLMPNINNTVVIRL